MKRAPSLPGCSGPAGSAAPSQAWIALQAAAAAVIRCTLALRRDEGADAARRQSPGALETARGAALGGAWRAELDAARAGLRALGIPPFPLFTTCDGAREPFGNGATCDVGVASGEGVASGDDASLEEFRVGLISTQREVKEALEQDLAADPLAALFEAVRAGARQKRQGQHLTPTRLADLVLGLAGLPWARSLLDPTCGTGTFLLRAAAWPGLEKGTRLYGSDLDPLAVQLAQLNLARFPGQPAVLSHQNALTLAPGAPFGAEAIALPAPDLVVGNLPYVRLHHLDPDATALALENLARRWAARDAALVRPGVRPRLRLGGHSDLYAILLFHLAEVMPEGTRFSLLTSNAWLDGRYGEALRLLLSRHFWLDVVVESHCERWFPEAAVNTVILVAERRERLEPPERPDCSERPALAERGSRFIGLRQPLLRQNDTVGFGPAQDPRTLAQDLLGSGQEQTFHRALVSNAHLQAPGGDKASTRGPGGWSVFLRAAPIYRALASSTGLVPAGTWLEVRRGVTTNCNPFFYPEGEDSAAIEPEYLLPVLRSPRQGGRGLLVEIASLSSRLFHCERTEAELRALGHWGALAWIARGRDRKTGRGITLPEALPNRPWYALRPARHRVVFTKAIHDTHRHPLLDAPAALDQRLYGVACSEIGPSEELLAAALNASLTALSAEVVGSTSLGEGALDLPVGRIANALLVPDARRLGVRNRAAVLEAFRALARGPATPAWEEVRRPERQALDRAWLVGLGLPTTWLTELHEALVARVRIRLDRAHSGSLPKGPSRSS